MGKRKLQILGFKVKEEFIERNRLVAYRCNDGIWEYIKAIKDYCNDILGKGYLADSILKFNKTINAINPLQIVFNEEILEDKSVLFYCQSDLTEQNKNDAICMLEENINEFIENNEKGLKENYKHISWDNFSLEIIEAETNIDEEKSINKELLKALFIKELAFEEIYIGRSENEKYIDKGINLKFYPCYSYNDGYLLISEIIDITDKGKFMYSIKPQIEYEEGKYTIYPIIGSKRVVINRKRNYIEFNKNKTISTLVFSDNQYFIPRIKKVKENGGFRIEIVSQDWKLYRYLEKKKGITFESIRKGICSEETTNNIALLYSSNSGKKNGIKSGVPGLDKMDICTHILKKIKEFELIETVDEIESKIKVMKKPAAINSSGKILTKNCIWRNDKNDISLFILQDKEAEASLYEEVILALQKGLFDNIEKVDEGYAVIIGETKLKVNIVDVKCTKALEPLNKESNETLEKRKEKILEELPKIDRNKINIAIMDIKNMGSIDAKQIVRNALDELGIINQSIEGIKVENNKEKNNININTVSACIKDLFNDVGLGNVNQLMGENRVIYTMHKIAGLNVICRIDDKSIEVKFTDFMEDYVHIDQIYVKMKEAMEQKYYLEKLYKDKAIYDNEVKNRNNNAIKIFKEDLEADSRDTITILEEVDTKKNTVLSYINEREIENIIASSKTFVKTTLMDYELLQFNEGKITKSKAIYEIKPRKFISMGEKVQAETNIAVDTSKIRSWKNTNGNITEGVNKEFADRLGYMIETSSYDPEIAKLVHNFRLSTTSHIHLNKTLATDYIKGLEKHTNHFNGGKNKSI